MPAASPDPRVAPSKPSTNEAGILAHATLIGLTPLIPVPLLDSAVQSKLMRRMVRNLAETYGLALSEEQLGVLVDEPSDLQKLAKRAVLLPLKLLLRKLFFVLTGRRIVELTSDSYHRGWLLDRVFAARWCAPAGRRSPAQVRAAIDAVLQQVPVASSPVTQALRAGLTHSRRGLAALVEQLRDAMSALQGEPRAEARHGVDRVIDDAATNSDSRGLGGIVAELRRSLTDVPQEHFDGLEHRLAEKLGPGAS